VKEGRSSFLKKRSKKLLPLCVAPNSKSLFASFSSEKEESSCLC
jgi:hypothetical protein